ncbi:MAG: TM2 domain-containing protein [Spirochaetes bacterium]|uniref:TM2 domain-containing protein n=1 Tax=Candidatus Aphodenecus pullistercoris TaxID=2840669 RepID=A0A9D9H6H4_9SPIR|nr:TM2 domain-containing protein [Candidatus Aphodenecus pullistercoris]
MAVLKKAPAVTSEQPAQQSGAININVSNSIEGQNQAAAYVPSSKSTKVVNKIVYCLLAFFLGGLGFHRFYAGKIGTGILYLLFCWTFIPSLLALIDFIIGLCKRSDSNGNIAV